MIVCIAFTACKKKISEEDGTGDITVTPTVTPTQSVVETEDDQTGIDTEDTEEESNTDTGEDYISESEAVKMIQNEIGERGYFIELLDDHISIGEMEYYKYEISDSTTKIEPSVLVNKVNGELLCYYSDGSTAPFSEFPLYTEPSESGITEETPNEFTQEDALDKLSKLSAETLGLPVKLTEYIIMYDDWTTNVNGVECYGINAFADVGDRKINMGVFYVAVDGSVMYKFDSLMDDFVEMEEE